MYRVNHRRSLTAQLLNTSIVDVHHRRLLDTTSSFVLHHPSSSFVVLRCPSSSFVVFVSSSSPSRIPCQSPSFIDRPTPQYFHRRCPSSSSSSRRYIILRPSSSFVVFRRRPSSSSFVLRRPSSSSFVVLRRPSSSFVVVFVSSPSPINPSLRRSLSSLTFSQSVSQSEPLKAAANHNH